MSCSKKIVRRKLVEKVILNEVRNQISTPEQFQNTLLKVQHEIENLSTDLPDIIHKKELELNSEERRLTNFIEFIGEGRGSRALGKALEESERKVDSLQIELEGLRQTRKRIFRAPPRMDKG